MQRLWAPVPAPMANEQLYKLIVTPTLIAAVTLVGRRFGPGVGGWLAGLPLTSGPVSLFLALEQGPAFAAQAATGMLVGMVAFVAFCLAMARSGPGRRWPMALLAGFAAYILVEAAVFRWTPPFAVALLACVAAIAAAILLLPRRLGRPPPSSPPLWDIPMRMAVATALVVLLTTLAPRLGPAGTGLLSPFPAFVSVLAAFTHRHSGAVAATLLLRGVLLGAFSFAAFFLVVGAALPALGIGATYALAAAAACSTNVVAFRFVRRPPDDEA